MKSTRQNINDETAQPVVFEPPAGLLDKVISRLDTERQIAEVKKRLLIFSAFLAVSMAAFFPTLNALRADFAQSGFGQYLALLLSDSRLLVNYWQDYSLALLETLPIASLAGALGVLLMILILFRLVLGYAATLVNLKHSQQH